MNRETIIQMAREAGFELDETDGYWVSFTHEIEALVALAVAKEAESRKAAQLENADLKERLARSGIEQRRAVAKEREECAKNELEGLLVKHNIWLLPPDEWRTHAFSDRTKWTAHTRTEDGDGGFDNWHEAGNSPSDAVNVLLAAIRARGENV